ncbi:hypothetical protein [Salegentibacter flavus]|uniref:Uncharacterized protein n=1 Tax=Salegentibacter flavus TaxID=287099 RepID=A0A1I5CJU0_9FLAO|nr:hypothetical protein [Salegentibacter flavus]SFN87167.1 hypothetical protein SAMN05660413_02879 [Salegentibacter flavus]
MPRIPLREVTRYDYVDQSEIFDDMLDFSFGYFYNGSRQGPKSDIIELSVVTWVMDFQENLFIRFCRFSGSKHPWKEKITEQIKIFMRDINISEGFIRRRLVDFEVGKEEFYKREPFEKKFLELKSRMKSVR